MKPSPPALSKPRSTRSRSKNQEAVAVPQTLAEAMQWIENLQDEKKQLTAELMQQRKLVKKTDANLRQAQALYELSPAANFTLNHEGLILKANLRGASMLGHSRNQLLNKYLGDFINDAHLPIFYTFLQRVFASHDEEICEVELLPLRGKTPLIIQIDALADANGQTCTLVLIDITARRQAEQASQHHYDLLTNLSAQVPGLLFQFRVDPDGQTSFPYVGGATEKLLGNYFPAVEANTQALTELIHPEDLPGVIASRELSEKQLSHWQYEYRVLMPNGEIAWRHLGAHPERLDNGGTVWHGYAIDITERRQFSEALRISEERWKFALEGANEGVWDWDVDSNVMTYSKRWKEILGHAENEITNNPQEWIQRIHPDFLPELMQTLQAQIDGQQIHSNLEFLMRHKNDEWLWIHGRGMVASRDANGRTLRIVGTIADINQRKHFEEALRISEERWKFALEGAGDGVWDRNMATGEAIYSRRWKEIMGYEDLDTPIDSADWIGRIHPEDQAKVPLLFQDIVPSHNNTFSIELRMICKDRSWKWVLIRGMVVTRTAEGYPLRVIGTNSDITDRKQVEEQLHLNLIEIERQRQEAENLAKAKSHFLNAASHDLRQPLYATQLFADAIALGKLSSQQKDTLDKLKMSIASMSAQLQMLLDVSRFDMGNIQTDLQLLSIHNIFNSLEITYSPIARKAGVRLYFHPQPVQIYTDQTLMTRLLGNLIDNAIKFSPHGTILVCSRRDARGVRFEVRDNGLGIPLEHQQKIFDEYYQIHNPERDPNAGLGLGLSIVSRIARLLELPLKLRSREGAGTTFSMTLAMHAVSDHSDSTPHIQHK